MKKSILIGFFVIIMLCMAGFGSEAAVDSKITDDQALAAIKNYCYQSNPELSEKEGSDDYTFYWNVESSDEKQIVVAYRSYTAAIVRYYINPDTGDTYVTEFVPDIMEEEQRTEEEFNVRDYMSEDDATEN